MLKKAYTPAALGIGLVALTTLATPAAAHVGPDKDEVPADSFDSVTLSVGHGCEESPTTELRIQIPEGLTNVLPEVHPGWELQLTEEELDEPIDTGEGEPITERVSEITYSAEEGNALPSHFRDSFTIAFRTPDTPGEYLFFKTIQACQEGENAWTEEYTGEGEEPEMPAPALLITDAESGGHDGGDDDTTDDTDEETASAGTEQAAAASDSSDGTGLAVAGIVIGALGLAAGATALVLARKAISATTTST